MKDSNFDDEINWFTKALNHHENDEMAQALLSINFYCEENPDNAWGLIAKALINTSLSNFEESEKALKLIDLKKNSSTKFLVTYYAEWGRLYHEKNEMEKAIEYYDKRIEIQPDKTPAYIYKGGALARMGRYKEAKEQHLKATKLEGDPDEAFENLGNIFRAELNLEDAKDAFENSLKLCANDENVEKKLEDVNKAFELKKQINAIQKIRQKSSFK
ncbi:MAG: hypothetical protein ABI723_01245 [Bacteroidia bacterium]